MANQNEINQNFPLVVRTLTPLHIGGPQEKHLLQGLDFVKDHGVVYLLDYDKIFNLIPPDSITEYLSGIRKGGIAECLSQNRIKLKDVSYRTIENMKLEGDIKTFVKNPVHNKPYIPGSSLKGALRSVVLGSLVPKNSNLGNTIMQSQILGKFETDIFRHIKLSDGGANTLEYFTAKIFNLYITQHDNKWVGGWKHGRENTNKNFNPDGFVSSYECIPGGIDIPINLKITNIDGSFWKNILAKKMVNTNHDKVLTTTPWKDLCIRINQHTTVYVNKEIAFLEKYKVLETPIILEIYKKILDLIPENNAYALLRMAHGSGFHSITGDWQFQDFDKTGFKNGKKKIKSRKFIFRNEKGGLKLMPMGFIILGNIADIPDIDPIFKYSFPTEMHNSEAAKSLTPEIKKIEAVFHKGNIKQNTELDAVVVQSGKPNQLDVFLNEPDKITLPLNGYAAERPVGEIMRVSVIEMDRQSGKPKRIKFITIKR